MKLELKHLSPYLPYGLSISCEHEILTLDGLDVNGDIYNCDTGEIPIECIKPILRPLSDLSNKKQIAEFYMSFKEHLKRIYPSETNGLNPATWSRRSVEWLLENHFDVFGLIENGLAIDKNTI
jgi:hypothetical protein